MNIKKWKFTLGIVLISISVLIFLTIFALPFVTIDAKIKIAITTILIVAGEVMFWIGILLIGKDVYLKFKSSLGYDEWWDKIKIKYFNGEK
jgi:hypothetical protein